MTQDITTHTVEVSRELSVTFVGVLLGDTTSRQPDHRDHDAEFAPRGRRCYACRWSEYRLYRVTEWITPTLPFNGGTGRYLVVSYGHSVVPGETTFRRVTATDSPAEVIEMLTTRKFGQQPVLTSSAARLLARASDVDRDIQEAYDNRAVL